MKKFRQAINSKSEMENAATGTHTAAKFGATLRKDAWWAAPAATIAILTLFVIYSTFRAFENNYYMAGPYLSPFYSPLLLFDWWPLSPALLILWAPAGFRFTCYYYRKAYYRAYAAHPFACAVGEPQRDYQGETTLLVFQNLHRFLLYAAIIVLFFLWHDVIKAFNFSGHFGMGFGTLILLVNTILLSGYTFSCHSFRHLVGGNLDCFSCAKAGKVRFKLWQGGSSINEHHMLWAWTSLFAVMAADLYVRLVACGSIVDLRIF